ncbi:hypothetical protein GXW82_08990 [Streptacidiphilus sp. 4-A2]|nr:hypothetical protein [Streptacidiphilus sp. 4-A2]
MEVAKGLARTGLRPRLVLLGRNRRGGTGAGALAAGDARTAGSSRTWRNWPRQVRSTGLLRRDRHPLAAPGGGRRGGPLRPGERYCTWRASRATACWPSGP